ncbi:MAG: hypothetical protein AB1414_15940 [bacterium]
MESILNFLNQNSGALMAIFTAIVTLSTIVYAVLTGVLVHETRKMRHAQTEPRVDVTYRSRDEWIALIDIVVKNIGLGPAYDVKFEITPLTQGEVAKKLVNELQERNFLKTGLNYLSPGQKISSFFTNASEKFDEKMTSQVLIKTSYKSSTGKKYFNEYVVDLSEIKGIERIGEPPLYKIAKNIEAIKKDINQFASGFRRLKTDIYTSEDREKVEAERRAYPEQLKQRQQSTELNNGS